MRRVLVTGAATPLGRRVAARLASGDGVETVIGADAHDGVLERAATSPSSRSPRSTAALTRLIEDGVFDTVVHVGMCPTRDGAAGSGAADVISTLHLTAGISDRRTSVRAVVAVSSTEVYVPRSSAQLWRREDEPLQPPRGSDAASILEAEAYLRDLAEHQPHISVAILRLADLVGAGVRSPVARLWDAPFVPYVAGYDPPVQVLHVDDAAGAVEHAARCELAGTMNVAGTGVVTWRRAARLLGRPSVPALVVPDAISPVLARLRAPHVPLSLADLVRFGRCVDTTASTVAGFTPRHSSASAVRETRKADA